MVLNTHQLLALNLRMSFKYTSATTLVGHWHVVGWPLIDLYSLSHTHTNTHPCTNIHICVYIYIITVFPPYPRVIPSKPYRGYVKRWIIPNAIYNVIFV
jgi:hypothetical protein